MCNATNISQYAESLGINPVDIDITKGVTKDGKPDKFRIDYIYPTPENIKKKLNKFISEMEYKSEIKNFKPDIKIITNQVNL